jgi:hypothetical protein
VISQFIARYLTERHLTLEQFKATIAERDETTIRRFLSGDLRLALINEIRAVAEHDGQVFAAASSTWAAAWRLGMIGGSSAWRVEGQCHLA